MARSAAQVYPFQGIPERYARPGGLRKSAAAPAAVPAALAARRRMVLLLQANLSVAAAYLLLGRPSPSGAQVLLAIVILMSNLPMIIVPAVRLAGAGFLVFLLVADLVFPSLVIAALPAGDGGALFLYLPAVLLACTFRRPRIAMLVSTVGVLAFLVLRRDALLPPPVPTSPALIALLFFWITGFFCSYFVDVESTNAGPTSGT